MSNIIEGLGIKIKPKFNLIKLNKNNNFILFKLRVGLVIFIIEALFVY